MKRTGVHVCNELVYMGVTNSSLLSVELCGSRTSTDGVLDIWRVDREKTSGIGALLRTPRLAASSSLWGLDDVIGWASGTRAEQKAGIGL